MNDSQTGWPLHPQLADFERRLSTILERGKKLLAPLSPAQWSYESEDAAWTMQRLLDHMMIANAVTLDLVQKAPPHDTGAAPWQGTYKKSLLPGLLIKRYVPKNYLMPHKPQKADDKRRHLGPFTYERFVETLNSVLAEIRQMNGRNINARVISPPGIPMRFKMGDALEMMISHMEGHFRHMEKIQQEPGWPTA